MAKTLSGVRAEVLYRLGDSTSVIWTDAEIDRYINEGYEKLAMGTGLLWDCAYLEDQSYAGNYTTAWETNYLEAGGQTLNRFHFTHAFEVDSALPGHVNLGPANHTTLWEYDNGYVATEHFLAVHQLPTELIEIERALWNKRRIEPLRSSELEFADAQYQTQQGEVMGYLRDKDGIRSFRKWRIPSQAADEYTVTGDGWTGNYTADWEPDDAPTTFTFYEQFAYTQGWEKPYVTAALQPIPTSNHTGTWEFRNTTQFGILRNPTEIADEEVIGSWGIPRRIPGEHPCAGDGTWGIPRRIWKAAHNTKIEYTKKGKTLVGDGDTFELPDLYVKYIRHFAMHRALQRDGQGQDLGLSNFWKALWENGLSRARKRKQSLMKTRIHILGGERVESGRPPMARLPWTYGKVVR
jgi:hypothetical protein